MIIEFKQGTDELYYMTGELGAVNEQTSAVNEQPSSVLTLVDERRAMQMNAGSGTTGSRMPTCKPSRTWQNTRWSKT
jgi:hypothetical protein